MFDIAIDFFKSEKTTLTEIRFTNFDETTVAIFEEARVRSEIIDFADRRFLRLGMQEARWSKAWSKVVIASNMFNMCRYICNRRLSR